MKIAVDCRMSGKSGIGTFLDGILPFLREKNEIFAFGTDEFPCTAKMFSPQEMFFFPKEILRRINSCDVYFSPYCNIPGGIKIPVFSTIHDVVFLDVDGLTNFAGKMARKFFYQRAIKKSAGIFTVSNFSRSRIEKNLHCTKKISVVYNGLPSYLNGNFPEVQKTDTIIFIGNIKRHKGLFVLLDAFEKLQEKHSAEKIRLLIVGEKEKFRTKDNSVEKSVEKINSLFENSVEFTGFVENEKLKILLRQAKVLVQPSLYEGFGIPPLEALFCGTKAVVSDIDVFKEIYDGFPVNFFRSEDSDDLCEKIYGTFRDETPLPEIPQKYSYEKTARIIMENLTQ
jgi:glycosyltransferase involved in cell wall biosynthesis